jgi:proteic killer suppression protein
MIRSFKDKGLETFFLAGKTSGIRADAAAMRPQDMALPGLRFHPLKGSLKGFYAVDVSGNWRVTFTFDGPDATEVDYLDYH